MKDYYSILGLERSATDKEIKSAYRKLSKKFHPDVNNQDNFFEKMFKDIQEAFETLSDPHRKRIYDSQQSNIDGFRRYSPPPQQTSQQTSAQATQQSSSDYDINTGIKKSSNAFLKFIVFTGIILGITIGLVNYPFDEIKEKFEKKEIIEKKNYTRAEISDKYRTLSNESSRLPYTKKAYGEAIKKWDRFIKETEHLPVAVWYIKSAKLYLNKLQIHNEKLVNKSKKRSFKNLAIIKSVGSSFFFPVLALVTAVAILVYRLSKAIRKMSQKL